MTSLYWHVDGQNGASSIAQWSLIIGIVVGEFVGFYPHSIMIASGPHRAISNVFNSKDFHFCCSAYTKKQRNKQI